MILLRGVLPMALKEAVSWKPETEFDRRLVQRELSAILSSSHFGNSKRYPAFLRYVVEKTLDGQAAQLKERTLGVEVFDRRPDYDTNADPVVRFSASEVRKRIAQYYHETGEDSEIQIELPLGSYAPTFRMRFDSEASAAKPLPQPVTVGQAAVSFDESESAAVRFAATRVQDIVGPISLPAKPPKRTRVSWGGLSLAVVMIALLGSICIYGYRELRPTPLSQAWAPLLQTGSPVLIVVGSGNLELPGQEPPATSLYDHMVGPYHHVSVSSALAISRLTNMLQSHGKSFTVKESGETSLTDLRDRPVILVGALNNAWTLRLIDPLRFRFVHGPQARIEDQSNAGNHAWSVDFNQPFTSVSSDYAIVARYRDKSTNGMVVIVAGLGPYGTEAASEFLSSSRYMEEMAKQLPYGLKDANVEMVIKTDVIAGQAGPPYLLAATTF